MAEAWYKLVSQEAQGQEAEDMVSHSLLQELALSDVPQGSTLFNGSPATRGHHLGPVGGYTHERLAVLNEHAVWKGRKGDDHKMTVINTPRKEITHQGSDSYINLREA